MKEIKTAEQLEEMVMAETRNHPEKCANVLSVGISGVGEDWNIQLCRGDPIAATECLVSIGPKVAEFRRQYRLPS